MEIVKRDGTTQEFDTKSIFNAVNAAAIDTGYDADEAFKVADEVTTKVVFKITSKPEEKVTVESVQDKVEKVLMLSKWQSVAKRYIQYRHDRDLVREQKGKLHKAVTAILERTDESILFENGNLDSETLTTQRSLLTGEVAKVFADKRLPADIVEAHEEGVVHFHDKNFNPMQPYTNCCLVDLKGMLKKGFKLGGASIGTPRSEGVGTAVTSQIIAQISSAMYGGTSIANIDTVLAPYVIMGYEKHLEVAAKFKIEDKEAYAKALTEKSVYDAFQGLEYEINSLFNSHAQSPFTTISFGTGTSWESRLIQKAILEVRIKGLGDEGITAIFPKLILFIEEGINLKKGDPNYDIKQLALKCASLRQYPDIISSKNNKEITGSSVPVTSMG